MTVANQLLDQAEQHCKAHGAKLTDKRKHVLKSLLQSKRAMSAYEITDYCKTELGQTLPSMSVYRILDFLEQERLVHKLQLANKYVACSHVACDHTHAVPQFFICGECQKVEEVNIDKSIIDELKKNVKNAGFELVSEQIEMNCVCDACASAAE